jgi:glycosyltransferase involved in cell wall biosynthesis
LILQYAKALKDAGAEVTLGFMLGTAKDVNWHPHALEFTCLPLSKCTSSLYDLAIATWWPTVFELPKIRASRHLYFVQSLESRFALNVADEFSEVKAAASYSFGIPMVTVASWLQNLLIAETGTPVWFIRNGIDRSVFPLAKHPKQLSSRKPKVLVEGVLGVAMKAVEETLVACRKAGDIELWHVTPEIGGGSAQADQVFEKVPFTEMAAIYSQVDVFVKMSRVEGMFGPPLEAFHYGTPGIFSKVTGFDEYIRDRHNSLVVEIDDFIQVEHHLSQIISDPDLFSRLSANALETARNWPAVEDSAREFVGSCFSVLNMNADPNKVVDKIGEFEKLFNKTIKNRESIRALVSPALLAGGE